MLTQNGGLHLAHLRGRFETVGRTDQVEDKTGVRVARSQHINLHRTTVWSVDPGSPHFHPFSPSHSREHLSQAFPLSSVVIFASSVLSR